MKEEHLFFECAFANEVSAGLLQASGYKRGLSTTWRGELQWVQQRCRGKGLKQGGAVKQYSMQ